MTNMVSVKMCDEDLVEAARSKVAPHELYLTSLATIKHPQPKVYNSYTEPRIKNATLIVQ